MSEFSPIDLMSLKGLAERIEKDVKWAEQRLEVDVYNDADTARIARISMHPSDSSPTICFFPVEKEKPE